MRLIDADKLEKYFEEEIEYYEKKQKTPVLSDKCKLLEYAFRDVLARTKSQPTVERPKGKWIERFDDDDKWVMCTNCHKDEDKASPFCPHCGADMREVEE